MNESQINIFDFDKDILPDKKFDVIISLLSLDYHYDFNLYSEYLKSISKENTKIKGIAETCWDSDTKTAYKTFIESQEL